MSSTFASVSQRRGGTRGLRLSCVLPRVAALVAGLACAAGAPGQAVSDTAPPISRQASVNAVAVQNDSEHGGIVVPITAYLLPGSGQALLPGDMQRSQWRASTYRALSWVTRHADPEARMSRSDVWFHVGERPLEVQGGRSAELALVCALAAAVRGVRCPSDTAVTGVIEDGGRVLPVSGMAEKIEAARRAGLRRILVPEENARDAERAAGEAGPRVVSVRRAEEALRVMLPSAPPMTRPVPPDGNTGSRMIALLAAVGAVDLGLLVLVLRRRRARRPRDRSTTRKIGMPLG